MEEKRNILSEWIITTAGSEAIGLLIPIIIGLAVAFFTGKTPSPATEIIMLTTMTLAGFLEGILLGFFQWNILKKYSGKINVADWAQFTALAVILGWSLGMLPTPIGENIRDPNSIFINSVVFLAPLFLALIGFAQWMSMRKHVKHAGKWVLANTIAWPIGIAAAIAVLSFLPPDYPAAIWIITGIMVGIMMGAMVGAITGIALVKVLNYKDVCQ